MITAFTDQMIEKVDRFLEAALAVVHCADCRYAYKPAQWRLCPVCGCERRVEDEIGGAR